MDITQTFLEKYAAKNAGRTGAPISADREQLQSYRKAASLLHCFKPDQLNPLEAKYKVDAPFSIIHEDLVYFSGHFGDGLYTLKQEIRNENLKDFASRKEMKEGLDVNPDRLITELQDMWEGYLDTGMLPPPTDLVYQQLINLYQIITWLEGIDSTLPEKNFLLAMIGRKSVLANFEHLVISNFTGRTKELETLRQHTTGSENKKPILAVFGPGGIGKSALVGKTLYEKAMAGETDRVPYVYLAFDQPSLRIEKPVTIFSECASQLELQYPALAGDISAFKGFILNYGTGKSEHSSRALTSESRSERILTYAVFDDDLTRAFAELLKLVARYVNSESKTKRNILITFDTFEEVQYRDRENLVPFGTMLTTLTSNVPSLRILIASRVPVSPSLNIPNFMDEIPLTELIMEDIILLLSRLGVKDTKTSMMIAERVGGNPLSLRLAARIVTDSENTSNLDELIPKKWRIAQIDEQLIQGQLYKRVLNHIHNEDVRKLAHPGMVLRKVTAELILKVLAPVCQIKVSRLPQAKKLFDELQKEHALVQLGEFNTLKYRPEIREIMVKLLKQDKWEEVRLLHQGAISYYFKQEGPDARAEEMYHRLALGTDKPQTLNERWTSGIEQSTASSLSEYSDSMKAWLASKMSLEVPREVFQNASAEEWERNITRKVKRALLVLDTDGAFYLLRERTVRSTSSPLYALEAKALLLIGNTAGADTVIDKGIDNISKSNNRGRLAELYWLKSQIAVINVQSANSDLFLEQAQLAIQQEEHSITLVHILCQRLLLHQNFNTLQKEQHLQILEELNKRCLRLNKNQKSIPGFIISLAVQFLADAYPATVTRLEDYYLKYKFRSQTDTEQSNMLKTENLRGLEKYRESWENDDDDDEERQLNEEFETFA